MGCSSLAGLWRKGEAGGHDWVQRGCKRIVPDILTQGCLFKYLSYAMVERSGDNEDEDDERMIKGPKE